MLVVALSLSVVGATTATAAPPPVLPHPPPIAAQFQLHPDSGPVGTQVKIQGLCGFSAQFVLYAVAIQDEDGFHTIWTPPEFTPLKLNPIGVFSVTFTFPSVANVGAFAGQPIEPGSYYVRAGCNIPGIQDMTPQPFAVTAGAR
jgi:hypothetical protein